MIVGESGCNNMALSLKIMQLHLQLASSMSRAKVSLSSVNSKILPSSSSSSVRRLFLKFSCSSWFSSSRCSAPDSCSSSTRLRSSVSQRTDGIVGKFVSHCKVSDDSEHIISLASLIHSPQVSGLVCLFAPSGHSCFPIPLSTFPFPGEHSHTGCLTIYISSKPLHLISKIHTHTHTSSLSLSAFSSSSMVWLSSVFWDLMTGV